MAHQADGEARTKGPFEETVDTLMKNEAGLSRNDLGRTMNRVLQTEAVMLMREKPVAGPEVAEHMQRRAEFGHAVESVRGKVLIDPTTCERVVEVDYDNVVSEATGRDIKSLYGANPDFDMKALAEAQQYGGIRSTSASGPDFSRGVQERGFTPGVELESQTQAEAPAQSRVQTQQAQTQQQAPARSAAAANPQSRERRKARRVLNQILEERRSQRGFGAILPNEKDHGGMGS